MDDEPIEPMLSAFWDPPLKDLINFFKNNYIIPVIKSLAKILTESQTESLNENSAKRIREIISPADSVVLLA